MMIFNIYKTKALNKYENNLELILNFHDYCTSYMSNYDSHAWMHLSENKVIKSKQEADSVTNLCLRTYLENDNNVNPSK